MTKAPINLDDVDVSKIPNVAILRWTDSTLRRYDLFDDQLKSKEFAVVEGDVHHDLRGDQIAFGQYNPETKASQTLATISLTPESAEKPLCIRDLSKQERKQLVRYLFADAFLKDLLPAAPDMKAVESLH